VSTEPGIDFVGVWKKFHRGEMHDSLRDLIPAMVRRVVGKGGNGRAELAKGDFWALHDVDFRVRPGDTLGIIGANGAGKSTVLKILNRILLPSRGYCEVRGRIGALIEIAAGFHPDLTGRENVFLQGAIMGMPSAEIRKKFDEIVAFSGIPEFIDTPVKRYSSGMNARLGFSIAAHLDPDVLVIDEVLSVGDLAFQKQAFDRISQLARSGLPVVVVSHQLERVEQLCNRALLLERGRIKREGTPLECITAYRMGLKHLPQGRPEDCPVRLDAVEVEPNDSVRSGDPFRIRVRGEILRVPERELETFAIRLRNLETQECLFATSSTRCRLALPETGPFSATVQLQANVPPGRYVVETSVWDPQLNVDAFPGPKAVLDVTEGASFWGVVQMNATMALDGERVLVPAPRV
jgi:ABC-type polysaccharide/polyol phosphate transport system ATPase subunit